MWWHAYALICLTLAVVILASFTDRDTGLFTDIVLVLFIAIILGVGVPVIPLAMFIDKKLKLGVEDE